MVYRLSMSTKHICSTIFPIMYLPDLPLAIFQCLQQNRRSTARIIVVTIISCQNSSYIRLASDTKLKLFSLNYKPNVRIRGSVIINVRERKFYANFPSGNETSQKRMLPNTKVRPTKLSFPGTKVLGYESSMNQIYLNT